MEKSCNSPLFQCLPTIILHSAKLKKHRQSPNISIDGIIQRSGVFMSIKQFRNLNAKQSLKSRINDSQQNLFEYTLMTARNTDFSTFDVLSVTRTDVTPSYQCTTVHRKVHTQAARVASQSAIVIPWPKRR
jgi:hypothetical protein